MDSRVKGTAWSLGLYTLFAAGKTLLNMPWHRNAPTESPIFEEPKAPVLERKISVIKTGAQVGAGALLLGAAAALESGLGGGALSSIASAAQSAASVVFENFGLTTKLLAAFALGYFAKRCLDAKTHPSIQNHIHINVNGGDVKPEVHYGKREVPLTPKQIQLFRRVVSKALERKRAIALEREKSIMLERIERENQDLRKLLKQLGTEELEGRTSCLPSTIST